MKDSKSDFIREIIGHHINNPLMVIQISLEKLKTKYPGIERDPSFDYIERSADRIKHAVRHLGKFDLDKEFENPCSELYFGVEVPDDEE